MKTIRYSVILSLVCISSLLPRHESRAGTICPSIEGSSSPSDPTYVRAFFWDVHGCQVPLREGVAHIPWQPGDFGYQHIKHRHLEGATNHELTTYAQTLWANAMAGPSSAQGKDFVCHSVQYRIAGGKKRTMRVYIDYKMVGGYKYKGIVTAFWVKGHRNWCN